MQLSRVRAWLLLVAFHHWVQAQDQNSFNPTLSQQIWSLAYSTTTNNPTVCVPKANSAYKVLKIVTVAGEPIFGQSLAVFTVSETQRQVHIHFRGPESVTTFIFSGYQYLIQANFPTQPFEGMQVAQEFAKTFTSLWQGGLREALNEVWEEYCDFPILITGHSVGSCLAQMFAVKIKKFGYWDTPQISLYAYASTRCGYQQFALAVNEAASTRYLLRYQENVINLPPTTCTSINPANPQNCYWHPGYAIQHSKSLFGVTSITQRCATGEATQCLAGTILSITNHNGFYSQTYGLLQPTC